MHVVVNKELFADTYVCFLFDHQHTTLSAPSACTAGYIHAYFQNGTLPTPGTTCEPDYFPFQEAAPDEEGDDDDDDDDDEDDELAAASFGSSNSNWMFRRTSMFG